MAKKSGSRPSARDDRTQSLKSAQENDHRTAIEEFYRDGMGIAAKE